MAFCSKCGTQVDNGAAFCKSCGTQIQLTQANQVKKEEEYQAPIFTPPVQNFAPPSAPAHNGPACYYHQGDAGVGGCARCGKYLCKDCCDSYGVGAGEYAGKVLCYDCSQQIVAENVALLKRQKTQIITTLVVTAIGMIIGAILFAGTANALAIIFGMLWIGSFWTWVKSSFSGWWNNPQGRSIAGFVGACIGGAIIAPFVTMKKIILGIIHLVKTSHFIESDSQCLQQMADYMEYTRIRNENKGVDLETLMEQDSVLFNNSFAQSVRTLGEEGAEAQLRQAQTTIAANGEIIRNFAA